MTDSHTQPPVDDVLHAISDGQRRLVLRELADAAEATDESRPEVDVATLESALESARGGPEEFAPPSEIEIKLHHVHLPTLEEVGLVEYDDERGRVEYRPHELAESLLELIDDRRPEYAR